MGGLCLWSFVARYWIERERQTGVPLPYIAAVLPITFHEETVKLLHARRFNGGLLNALADNRTFAVGLQGRMEDMFEQTFESLNFGISADLMVLTKQGVLKPSITTFPPVALSPAGRQMLATAERLAHWFVTYPCDQICAYLQIRI